MRSFTPTKRGALCFSHAEGGAQKVLTSFLQSFSHIEGGGRKKFPLFKRGA